MADTKPKEEEGKKKKKSPLPIIIGVVALLAVLFVGKTVLGAKKDDGKAKKENKHHKSSSDEKDSDKKSKDDEKDSKEETEEVGISLPLDEFLVNLNGGGEHYLRATVALGLKKGLTEELMKEHIAAMRDAILTTLSSKSLDELNKPKSREALKGEIKDKVNEEVEKEPVVKVYFTAFATQ